MLLIVTTFFVACNCWGLSSYVISSILTILTEKLTARLTLTPSRRLQHIPRARRLASRGHSKIIAR